MLDGIILNSQPSQTVAIVQYAAWAPPTAFTATLVTLWWLVGSRVSRIALDRPNTRSLHHTPVPRTGGIAVHLGIVLAWLMAAPDLPAMMWAALVTLIAVSFLDDVHGVHSGWRFSAHMFSAALLVAVLVPPDFGIFAATGAILGVAWMINLYNFMDGSDGLAGGMALFGFSFYGIAAWLAGNTDFALLNLSIAAAAAAFLVFNFHPARIFMGDIGSVPLGFLAASFGLYGWLEHYWNWWFPVLVFSPFIVDASVTLARRLCQRQKIWEAHRDHYYQRLVQLGWGHRNTALAEYALMAICGACGLAGLAWPFTAQAVLIGVFMVAYLVLIGVIEHMWHGFRTRQ